MVRHRRPPGQAERLGHHLGRPGRSRASSGSPMTARSPTSRSPPTWPSTPPNPPSPSASSPGRDHRRTTPRSTPTRAPTRGGSSPPASRLGAHPHEDFKALRRWAHMLGYRGHFATKSRRYSTTMRALRAARRDWQRRQHPARRAPRRHEPSSPLTDLQWAGRGWRTTGDALLALSAAARAREHRRAAREEAHVA